MIGTEVNGIKECGKEWVLCVVYPYSKSFGLIFFRGINTIFMYLI